jgi:hypothetical protein
LLKCLSQRSYLQWKYREGQLTKQSDFAPSDKPIVLLTNEQSLRDVEMSGVKPGILVINSFEEKI